jgi:hypothetical protein
VASTVPVSPAGLELHAATSDGVMVLRIPDIKPLAKLAAGFKANPDKQGLDEAPHRQQVSRAHRLQSLVNVQSFL